MERELCLILDTKGYHRLVLKKGTIAEIDEYTSRYFESNDDIKKKYQKEIDEFLEKYKDKLQNSNRPDYKGRLAIVLPENIGKGYTEYQREVLLKKHIVIFNEYIKHERVMKQFVRNNSYLFSEMMFVYINSRWSINGTKTKINEWLKELKRDKKSYYNILRKFVGFYHKLSKDKIINANYPTIDEFYNQYKAKRANNLSQKIKEKVPLKLESSNHEVVKDSVVCEEEKFYTVNDEKYTMEELEQFDLDDNAEYSDLVPDGLGKIDLDDNAKYEDMILDESEYEKRLR